MANLPLAQQSFLIELLPTIRAAFSCGTILWLSTGTSMLGLDHWHRCRWHSRRKLDTKLVGHFDLLSTVHVLRPSSAACVSVRFYRTVYHYSFLDFRAGLHHNIPAGLPPRWQKVRQSLAPQPRYIDVPEWVTTSAVQPTFWDSDRFNFECHMVASWHPTGATLAGGLSGTLSCNRAIPGSRHGHQAQSSGSA